MYSQEVIDLLRQKAKDIGQYILKEPVHGKFQRWQGYTGYLEANPYFDGPGEIRFNLAGQDREDAAWIKFTNIRPLEIKELILHPVDVRSSGEQLDSQVSTISNKSSMPVERSYTHKVGEEKHIEQSVGVAFTVGFEQTISYSGGVVSGETKFSTSLETTWNRMWGSSKSAERETTTVVPVAPGKRVSVISTKELGSFTQKCTAKCILDFDVEVYSHRRFQEKFEGYDALDSLVKGYLTGSFLKDWYHEHSKPNYASAKFYKPVMIDFELEGKSSTIGEINITEEDI